LAPQSRPICIGNSRSKRAPPPRPRNRSRALQRNAADSSDPAEWQQLAPLLDQLIGELPRADREAILLRYYRGLPFAEVAAQIGTTPDTARKRVDRAVEKLRRLAADQGLVDSVATATVTATAPVASAMAASCANIVKGATIMMWSTKLAIAASAARIRSLPR
jgi:Sigma-70, region 4